MKICLTNQKGGHDVTELVASASWAGDYRNCARSLDIGLLSAPGLPAVDCPVGSAVTLAEDGRTLFSGYVFSRTKSTASSVIDLGCCDRGIYLKRNQASRRYDGVTPEAATRQLCADFGIPAGALAQTGVTVSRKFLGRSLYEMIATLYTLAAETTALPYHIAFEGGALTVRTKGPRGRMIVLQGGSNLMDATTTESGEEITNRVAIEDRDGRPLISLSDDESVAAYGLMRTVLRQSDAEDVTPRARRILADEGRPTQKITVNAMGDLSLVTGGAVMVREAMTGLYGLFYIDADAHQWKNGLHTCKLTLNCKAVMDEKEAGELLEKSNATDQRGGFKEKIDQEIERRLGKSGTKPVHRNPKPDKK